MANFVLRLAFYFWVGANPKHARALTRSDDQILLDASRGPGGGFIHSCRNPSADVSTQHKRVPLIRVGILWLAIVIAQVLKLGTPPI